MKSMSIATSPTRMFKKGAKFKLRVQTEFLNESQCSLSVRLKQPGRFTIDIPKRMHGNKRTEIVFGVGRQEGACMEWGQFIADQLRYEVQLWQNISSARLWFQHKDAWRQTLRTRWKAKLLSRFNKRRAAEPHFTPSRAKCKLTVQAPLAYKGKTENSCVIRIPEFYDQHAGGKKGSVMSIRIRARQNENTRNKPQVYMCLPRLLTKDAKRAAQVSMGVKFGTEDTWRAMITNYTTYAVQNCTSFHELRNWCTNSLGLFLTLLQEMYQDVRHRKPFWRIGISTIKEEKRSLRSGCVHPNSAPTTGVFCQLPGRHTIYFGSFGNITTQINKKNKPLTEMQTFYQVGADPVDKMIVAVPANKAFLARVVHIGFIVHHRSVNPTHKLGFCYARHVPCLLPIKRTEVGDEFCFRRMHKPFNVIARRPNYQSDALSLEI